MLSHPFSIPTLNRLQALALNFIKYHCFLCFFLTSSNPPPSPNLLCSVRALSATSRLDPILNFAVSQLGPCVQNTTLSPNPNLASLVRVFVVQNTILSPCSNLASRALCSKYKHSPSYKLASSIKYNAQCQPQLRGETNISTSPQPSSFHVYRMIYICSTAEIRASTRHVLVKKVVEVTHTLNGNSLNRLRGTKMPIVRKQSQLSAYGTHTTNPVVILFHFRKGYNGIMISPVNINN